MSAALRARTRRARVGVFSRCRVEGFVVRELLQERVAGCEGNDEGRKQWRKRCTLVEKVHARDEGFYHKRPLDLEDRPIFSCQEDRPQSVSPFDSFNPVRPAISTRWQSLHPPPDHRHNINHNATCVFEDGPRWAQAGHLHGVRDDKCSRLHSLRDQPSTNPFHYVNMHFGTSFCRQRSNVCRRRVS